MADKKISALPAASTPLAGTEVLPIVQGGTTDQVSIANLTAGRDVDTKNVTTTAGRVQINYNGSSGNPAFDLRNTNGTQWELYSPTSDSSLKLDVWVPGQRDSVLSIQNVAGLHDITFNFGNLVVGTAGKGIDFSANTHAPGMTSELLNDYEEGTWTPSQGAGLTVVGTFSSSGTYTKIGRFVFVRGVLQATTSVAATAGAPFCGDFPFTVDIENGTATTSTASSNSPLLISGTIVYPVSNITAAAQIVFSATFIA